MQNARVPLTLVQILDVMHHFPGKVSYLPLPVCMSSVSRALLTDRLLNSEGDLPAAEVAVVLSGLP